MASLQQKHRSPHEVTLTDFRVQTSLLPIGDDGSIVGYDDRPAGHWKTLMEQTFRRAVTAVSKTPSTIDDRVLLDMNDTLALLKRDMGPTTAVLPIVLPEIDHWIVAFNAPVFQRHQAQRQHHRHDGIFAMAPVHSVRSLFGMLDLEGSDGDPVRCLHNRLCSQAREEGLLTDRNDPRRNDPLYRRQAGLPALPTAGSTTRLHTTDHRPDLPGAAQPDPRVRTAPPGPMTPPVATNPDGPIDREARRRAYDARRAMRPLSDDDQ